MNITNLKNLSHIVTSKVPINFPTTADMYHNISNISSEYLNDPATLPSTTFGRMPPTPYDNDTTTISPTTDMITTLYNMSTTIPATLFGNGENKMSTIASIIYRSATTTEAPPEFLGVSITAWITMLCVVCGVILIALLLLACCCLCCPVSTEEEEKAKKSAETASTQKRNAAAPIVPVATETVIEKHTNHLPDGRQITTIASVRTTTSSNGSKDRKTSRVRLLSKKSSSKHRRHNRQQSHHRQRPSAANRRQHPTTSSHHDSEQQLPLIRSKTPRTNSTVIEMGAIPQPPTYQNNHHQSSRHLPPPSSSSANYNVEAQPPTYPF